MRTVSSYGVEIRKQNIPVRQTMEIYRSGCRLPDRDLRTGLGRTSRKIPDDKKAF